MSAAIKCRLEGTLLRPALPRTYTDGTCTVLVLIEQTGGMPVLAERCYGTGAAASYAAGNAARDMRQGMPIVVYGKRIKADRWHGEQVLRLDAVDHIEHAHAHHTEPLTAQAA